MKVKVKNGLTKRLLKFRGKLKDLDTKTVKVGHFGGDRHPDPDPDVNITYASLMQILNDGWDDVPPRPVIRKTLEYIEDNKKPIVDAIFRKHINDEPDVLAHALGRLIMEEIQSNFGAGNKIGLKGNPMPNRKGRDDPLIDTTALRDAMEVKVD